MSEFNLLDQPWIRVMDSSCRVTEVSLTQALTDAHKYSALAGELPAQDAAVMRLMLAVLHTVISRYDENGEPSLLDGSKKDALRRWKGYWENGCLPENAIKDYLAKWHERFWLFHEERPFGQLAGLKVGTDYDSPKLNGEISESGNKSRLFSSYSGKAKRAMSYSQAARWLLYLNAYDDTSSKPTKEGKEKAGGSLPSTGVGWLGKLGIIFLVGNDLFETLMLNLVMINNGIVQSEQRPSWESDSVPDGERVAIPVPDDLAGLYTVQSRRILLNRKDGEVVSYKLLGGDFFEKENAFSEPMTVWRTPKKDNEPYTLKRHDSSKQMWREFAAIYGTDNRNIRAGVIEWYQNILYGRTLLPEGYLLRTAIVSVEYGDKDFFVKNVFSDSLTMHSALLSELGADWRSKIETEIKNCGILAGHVGRFSQELYIAEGGSDSAKDKHYNEVKQQTQAQLYYWLDMPFREWLRSIDPHESGEQQLERIRQWQETAQRTARRYADELVNNAAESALVGHRIGETVYSAPKAKLTLLRKIKKLYESG